MRYHLRNVSPCQLFPDMVGTLGVGIVVAIEEVGEEEELYNHKKYKQLQENNNPKSFPDGHFPEAIAIEKPYFFNCFHRGLISVRGVSTTSKSEINKKIVSNENIQQNLINFA